MHSIIGMMAPLPTCGRVHRRPIRSAHALAALTARRRATEAYTRVLLPKPYGNAVLNRPGQNYTVTKTNSDTLANSQKPVESRQTTDRTENAKEVLPDNAPV